MIHAITVTNHLGQSLRLELTKPEESGLLVCNVEGLGPAKANVSVSDIASMDGARFNSSRVTTRNIVLTLAFLEIPMIEDARHKTYQYFPIKKRVKLEVETDRRTCYTYGYVESNEPGIFSQIESAQISILCPNSYFYESGSGNTVVFSGVDPLFEFPFSNEGRMKGNSSKNWATISRMPELYVAPGNPRCENQQVARDGKNIIVRLTAGYGFYRSTDGGETWVHDSRDFDQVAAGNGVFLGCSGLTVFASDPSGERWIEISESVLDAEPIVLIGCVDEKFYVLKKSYTYVSDNRGLNWEKYPYGYTYAKNQRSNLVGGNGVVGYYDYEGMHISTDGGKKWSLSIIYLDGKWVNTTMHTSAAYGNGTFVVTGYSRYGDSYIAVSHDNGANWVATKMKDIPGGSRGTIAISVAYGNGAFVIMTDSFSPLFVSYDFGDTWERFGDYTDYSIRYNVWKDLCFGDGWFTAISQYNTIMTPEWYGACLNFVPSPNEIPYFEPELELGEYRMERIQKIHYTGDVEIGMEIVMHCKGSVDGIVLYHVDRRETMRIDTSKISKVVGDPLKEGDEIVISTVPGEKRIELLRDGTYYNIINALDKNADWFLLQKGINTIGYGAELGVENLYFKITYNNGYQGA